MSYHGYLRLWSLFLKRFSDRFRLFGILSDTNRGCLLQFIWLTQWWRGPLRCCFLVIFLGFDLRLFTLRKSLSIRWRYFGFNWAAWFFNIFKGSRLLRSNLFRFVQSEIISPCSLLCFFLFLLLLWWLMLPLLCVISGLTIRLFDWVLLLFLFRWVVFWWWNLLEFRSFDVSVNIFFWNLKGLSLGSFTGYKIVFLFRDLNRMCDFIDSGILNWLRFLSFWTFFNWLKQVLFLILLWLCVNVEVVWWLWRGNTTWCHDLLLGLWLTLDRSLFWGGCLCLLIWLFLLRFCIILIRILLFFSFSFTVTRNCAQRAV